MVLKGWFTQIMSSFTHPHDASSNVLFKNVFVEKNKAKITQKKNPTTLCLSHFSKISA